MSQHIHAPVPRVAHHQPDLPGGLDELVARLLAKNPEERPAHAGEIADALRRLEPKAHARHATHAPLQGRVLVVEDEPAIRRILSELLRRRGVTVLEAGDGLEGIALAAAEKPDLVFLDIGMPGLDGVSALKALQANPDMAGKPVVMLTGSLDPEHPALARGLGAVAYLNKPVNSDVLDLVLDKYLG
jgi:CheY-like chemotaxis protein